KSTEPALANALFDFAENAGNFKPVNFNAARIRFVESIIFNRNTEEVWRLLFFFPGGRLFVVLCGSEQLNDLTDRIGWFFKAEGTRESLGNDCLLRVRS